MQRPKAFSADKWRDLETVRSRGYVVALGSRYLRTSGLSQLAKAFGEERTAWVFEGDWEKFFDDVSRAYFAALISEVATDNLSEIPPEAQNLSRWRRTEVQSCFHNKKMQQVPDVITTFGARKFLKSARPLWMTQEEYDCLKKRSEDLLETDVDRERYRSLLFFVKSMLYGAALPEKAPPEVVADDWQKLKEIETETTIARESNRKLAQKDAEVTS